ncbi:hypothetical protein C8F04DRAFT_1390653 [Mycena alexandri]|uniref:Uncharacterized protein n=1 Tax=Mycena alexandri TaxID=1745969 RepID=A0AAD6TAA3_9AGAR|nr:hypothetical protein C8F04DRAFT_1390653 [Mycena alexandri]
MPRSAPSGTPQQFRSTPRGPPQHTVPEYPVPYHVPPHIEAYLAALNPKSPPEYRRFLFNHTVEFTGGYEQALAYFQDSVDVIRAGAGMPGAAPPANADVHTTTVGPLTIFYHSMFPVHMQGPTPFSWNFYIGSGPEQHSIITDWEAKGITVHVMGYTCDWEKCTLGSVLPSTRVRIAYSFAGKKGIEELIFPPDPTQPEPYVPVRALRSPH